MIIDIEAREGEWFSFFESKIDQNGNISYEDPREDAGRVMIRSLVPFLEEVQSKRKQKAEFVLNKQTRSMERVVYFEEPTAEQARKERDDTWDYAIVKWEDFYDKHGKEIPCTRENKLALMRLPVFDRFMARCLQLLAESGVKSTKDAEKNESTS